jgi:hypothetical protein
MHIMVQTATLFAVYHHSCLLYHQLNFCGFFELQWLVYKFRFNLSAVVLLTELGSVLDFAYKVNILPDLKLCLEKEWYGD